VYRVPRGEKRFKEIMQTGLEVIGQVDSYTMGEVLMLAARSLASISDSYALDVADLGIVSGILEGTALDGTQRARLLSFISEKNLHGLKAQCDAFGVDACTAQLLGNLVTVYGPFEKTLPLYEQMGLPPACEGALRDLHAMLDMMQAYGIKGVNLDFSVINDMNYYNGLIFSGFVEGVPRSVLSGGRYDYLMQKMGRSAQAMGFAVYLDQLGRLLDERAACDVDVLITYGADTPVETVLAAAQQAAQGGASVRVQRAGKTAVHAAKTIAL